MEQMFLKILNMSITASYCALAVLVLRLFLKNLPKIYSYVLWLIVAFRLICPVSFENVFSLMRIPTEVISTNTAAQQLPEIKIGNAEAVVDENRTLLFVGNVLWLMGATGFLGYGIGSYERMRRELRDAKEIDAGIFLSERLRTPFVLGYFKPQIYLPEGLSSVERTYVVEHERTHIRRGDHIIKSSSFFLMSLYWFNPVLWFSFFMMCKDMEMSCDEKVIKKFSVDNTQETKKEYASTLLALACNHQFSFGGPISFGEGNIKKRIRNVLQYKKCTVVMSIGLMAVVIVMAVLLISNPKQADAKTVHYSVESAMTDYCYPTEIPIQNMKDDTYLFGTDICMRKEDQYGTGYLYGVISKAIIENEYFTLEVPEEYLDEIVYYADIKEHAVQSIFFCMKEVTNMEDLNEFAHNESEDKQLAGIAEYYWDGTKYNSISYKNNFISQVKIVIH